MKNRRFMYIMLLEILEERLMIEKILQTIATYAKIDIKLLTPETNILELDVDSLCILKIIMDIEGIFNVRFDDEEIVEIRTAKDIENAILKKFA